MNSLLNAKFVSSGTVDELYFPTVAICNINQIRKSFIHELNLSEYELKQIKRMIYTGSDKPMTKEEIKTVVDIATRRFGKGTGHRLFRRQRSKFIFQSCVPQGQLRHQAQEEHLVMEDARRGIQVSI